MTHLCLNWIPVVSALILCAGASVLCTLSLSSTVTMCGLQVGALVKVLSAYFPFTTHSNLSIPPNQNGKVAKVNCCTGVFISACFDNIWPNRRHEHNIYKK